MSRWQLSVVLLLPGLASSAVLSTAKSAPPALSAKSAPASASSWGRLSFATGSSLEKVNRNVRLMTAGPLLAAVQQSSLFDDCKTFVDMPMRVDPEDVMHAFYSELPSNPSDEELGAFVDKYFLPAGTDLTHCEPVDFSTEPDLVHGIVHEGLRDFGYYLHSIWPQLFRRVDAEVREQQARHSLLALPYPTVVPGGRFRESYYWDTYWIVEGLLVSGLHTSARGTIKNLLSYIEAFGFVPNGGRSQPPMLSEMVAAYYRATGDIALLRHALPLLDREYSFWMSGSRDQRRGHAIRLVHEATGQQHTLNVFRSCEATPRPESYREDVELVEALEEPARAALWCHIRAAAESGWDFSSRWMADGRTLSTTSTSEIVPVGLNAILLRFERNMATLYAVLAREDTTSGAEVGYMVNTYLEAKERRKAAMHAFLYWPEGAQWRDWHVGSRQPVSWAGTTAANWLPLWAGCLPPGSDDVERSIASLESSGLLRPAGVLTTTAVSGQQWDAPNAWPPLQHMLIVGLQQSGTQRGRELAHVLACTWLGSNFVSWRRSGFMHEKYDAERIGESGGGGEYTPQTGFGWSNGVALSLLRTYGGAIEVAHGDDGRDARFLHHWLLDEWRGQPEAVLPRKLSPRRLQLLSSAAAQVGMRERAWHAIESMHESIQGQRRRRWGWGPAVAKLRDAAAPSRRAVRLRAMRAELARVRASRSQQREAMRRQQELARRADIRQALDAATKHGWIISQTRAYVTAKDLFDRRTRVDWRELSGRRGGARGYRLGDLSRTAYMRLRNQRPTVLQLKYAVLKPDGRLTLFAPLDAAAAPTTTDGGEPTPADGAGAAGGEGEAGGAADVTPALDLVGGVQSMLLQGASAQTLWAEEVPEACLVEEDVCVDDDLDPHTRRNLRAVSRATAELASAVGVREKDDQGRELSTFTLSSAPVGTQVPQTWRLSAHSLADAEDWLEVLREAM